jgi:GntR family transcriptional regulator, histidine utilization repressor
MTRRRPKFAVIATFAREKVRTGKWRPGDQVPSENELSTRFEVSRMTARRALEELARDGLIVRRQGSGSYIADGSVRSSFLRIRNIAEEIAESGRTYSSRVLKHRAARADSEVATALDVPRGTEVFHSLVIHQADGEPVQLEDRYVRADVVPEYLKADLSAETPNHYLQRVCPLVEARQEIAAVLPTSKQQTTLAIGRNEPCLLIKRITSAKAGLVSFARILAPASRYRLAGELIDAPMSPGRARR